MPSPYLPADGGELTTLPAVLVVIDGGEPLGQDLNHRMLLGLESTLETVVASVDGLSGSPDGETTGWLLDTELEENTWYYWTAWAQDDYTVGDAMAPASFFVNQFNEAPGVPGLDRPPMALSSDLELVALHPMIRIWTPCSWSSPPSWRTACGSAAWKSNLSADLSRRHRLTSKTAMTLLVCLRDRRARTRWASLRGCMLQHRDQRSPPTVPDLQTPTDEVVSTLTPEFVVTTRRSGGSCNNPSLRGRSQPDLESEALQTARLTVVMTADQLVS